ncbi:CsgE family curli-type amyloid fiber assembly protein [Halomonas urumqiensis]|uniref:Curli production assembly/transport component CsgE n=1 Tax=Halomonas urumqiensis TaxID=1684789 RepID=A0A2N7UK40_9GAMM|nr:CsgE family curli-type amyloid fiber assembly protein [Halomonas urumqiensis]PMR80785.1 curli production assembly protein CsgE [Halomonas urumqiensis]PTB02933.1 curli production assembly protein CsgE [Halomonas urumqiensis]
MPFQARPLSRIPQWLILASLLALAHPGMAQQNVMEAEAASPLAGQQDVMPEPGATDGPSAQKEPDIEINDADPQQALERQFQLDRPELSGLIVDRTMTMAGKTFYRTFSQLGMQDPILNRVVLTIHERPDPRWGSQVWITERNSVLFRSQLSPRINEADENARAALEAVQERVLSSRVSAALQSNKDLAEEEL